ncbi:MAG TPA: phosphatidylinositol-specific phospholipase C domain-containing protein [Polyangium sp.]|nr:phosphatidylinositol-specific phospholipase C domain-containing protein [Polyangium sp.]
MNMNNWMSGLPNSLSLSNMSIPGTHDSATFLAGVLSSISWAAFPLELAQEYVQCQTKDFPTQLGMGIRFLDLRVMPSGGGLMLCHGKVPLVEPLQYALNAVKDFLSQNPTETVLVSVKNDGDGDIGDVLSAIVSSGTYPFYTGIAVPTLGEVRGRMVLINRIGAKQNLGIHVGFPNNTTKSVTCTQYDGSTLEFAIQDAYTPSTALFDSSLTNKIEAIERGYAGYSSGSYALRFAFLSATYFPTRTPRSFAHGINLHVWRFIYQNAKGSPWITIMDYVGEEGTGQRDAVAAVLNANDFSGGQSQKTELAADQSLHPGESIYSQNKTYQAIMQSDGNFVVYRLCDNYVMGATATHGTGANIATMQTDGNFVVYAGTTAKASTATNGAGAGCRLVMQNDGNLVIYDGSGKARWSLYTGKFK